MELECTRRTRYKENPTENSLWAGTFFKVRAILTTVQKMSLKWNSSEFYSTNYFFSLKELAITVKNARELFHTKIKKNWTVASASKTARDSVLLWGSQGTPLLLAWTVPHSRLFLAVWSFHCHSFLSYSILENFFLLELIISISIRQEKTFKECLKHKPC